MSAQAVLLFCVVVWGWTFVATRVCLEFLSPLAVVALRFLIGVPVLAAIVAAQRVPFRFSRRDALPLLLGSGIIAVHFVIQALALTHTSATNTGWIIAFSPLAIAALAYLLLGERLSRRALTGIGIATAGIVLLVSRGELAGLDWLGNWGDALALASAFTWAAYTIATRDLSRARPPLAVTLAVFIPLTAGSVAVLAWTSGIPDVTALPGRVLIALAFLGVLGTAAQWFWQSGVAKLGAARAGIFLYLEPLATTALAVPLLHESFGLATATGGIMVLAGVAWAERGASHERQRAQRAQRAAATGTAP